MKLFLIFFSIFLFTLSFLVFFWFFLKKKDKQKNKFVLISCFECGFENSQKSRQTFSLRFFFLLILFVMFDVELVLLFQLPLQMKNFFKCRILFLFFLAILILGLFEEWRRGFLIWKN